MVFISRVYRPDNKWLWYGLVAVELPATVALLALFGIADPDLYRTKLWADGAENGFNSSPQAALYAAANYRPYTTPGVWSQFITSYNVVISVLSTFIMLVKIPMFIVHAFPPLLSAIAHGALVALYAVSLHYQAGSDMSDPAHPQPGPPWYITKSCSVAKHPSNIGYCQQAKSAFAVTIIATFLFAAQTIWSLYSLYPSKQTRALHSEKTSRSKSAYAEAAALSPAPSTAHRSLFPAALRSARDRDPSWPKESAGPHGGLTDPSSRLNAPSSGFGGMVPMTPRTQAFNRPGAHTTTRDLPLRNHFSSPNAPRSPTFGVKSPLSTTFESASDLERGGAAGADETDSPATIGTATALRSSPIPPQQSGEGTPGERGRGPMYFPPPPKRDEKKKGKK